jgi:hypothetical protein
MGGSGSGHWYRLGSKTTVEDSHWLGIGEFRDRLYPRYFGCRRCHNLTYESSQEAHNAERFAVMLGFGPEVGKLLDSRWCGKRLK